MWSMWNMRAEGGFLVSGVMKTLETQWVRVESLYGNECIVRVRGFEEVDWEPRTILVHAAGLKRIGGMIIRNATFRIELKRGESVVLHPKGTTPELVSAPATGGCFDEPRMGPHLVCLLKKQKSLGRFHIGITIRIIRR